MSEDQAGRGIHPIHTTRPAIRTIQTHPIRATEPTPTIKTKGMASQGLGYWEALPTETRGEIEGEILSAEAWLAGYFPEDHTTPNVLDARHLSLQRLSEIQQDPAACSIIATANAFRVLDGPNPAYTQRGIQDRIQRLHGARWTTIWPETLKDLTESGEPYEKFESARIASELEGNRDHPKDFLTLMQQLDNGSVATLDWKISPTFIDTEGERTTHARTIAGFSIHDKKIYFHIIDPYKGSVDPWLFRDLVAAVAKPYGLKAGVITDRINTVSRQATLISKATV